MKNLWRVLSLLIALGSTIPSEAKEPDPPRGAVLTVRGEGKSEVKPTYALLDASVVSTAATLNGATEAQAERATRAVALM